MDYSTVLHCQEATLRKECKLTHLHLKSAEKVSCIHKYKISKRLPLVEAFLSEF
jgi:hypothetical protein